MNKLQTELQRLYFLPTAPNAPADLADELIDEQGRVRAMVLELTGPPSWELLSRVWIGVQTELEWPAPAIAVSGTDGLQLWFSLAEPIAAARAHACVLALRERFVADVDPRRVRLMPAADASGHARRIPAEQEPSGNWSAFVARDLAPVFDETPWLDIPPGEEGQANVLRSLDVTTMAAFEAAMHSLVPRAPMVPVAAATPLQAVADTATPLVATGSASEQARRFLLRVMHDETQPVAVRIEAAKALLPHP
jgi:hypothetical protein